MDAMRVAVGFLAALTALAACSGTAAHEVADAARADAARFCAPAAEPPARVGLCDGQGRAACVRWAQAYAGNNPDATAQCVAASESCVRADRCDNPFDAATCRCGGGPACAANQACLLTGLTARCECTQP